MKLLTGVWADQYTPQTVIEFESVDGAVRPTQIMLKMADKDRRSLIEELFCCVSEPHRLQEERSQDRTDGVMNSDREFRYDLYPRTLDSGPKDDALL